MGAMEADTLVVCDPFQQRTDRLLFDVDVRSGDATSYILTGCTM